MAQNTIKASEISELLLNQLRGIDTSLQYEEVGHVLTVSDGFTSGSVTFFRFCANWKAQEPISLISAGKSFAVIVSCSRPAG